MILIEDFYLLVLRIFLQNDSLTRLELYDFTFKLSLLKSFNALHFKSLNHHFPLFFLFLIVYSNDLLLS